MTQGEPGAAAEPVQPQGDAVCWLHLVCESCGALLEREGDPHRPGCDAAPREARP